MKNKMIDKYSIGGSRTFPSETEFLARLRQEGWETEYIKKIHSHESQHLNKAIELGHYAQYAITFTPDGILPAIFIPDIDSIPKQDLINIISAPDELSPGDLERLERLRT